MSIFINDGEELKQLADSENSRIELRNHYAALCLMYFLGKNGGIIEIKESDLLESLRKYGEFCDLHVENTNDGYRAWLIPCFSRKDFDHQHKQKKEAE